MKTNGAGKQRSPRSAPARGPTWSDIVSCADIAIRGATRRFGSDARRMGRIAAGRSRGWSLGAEFPVRHGFTALSVRYMRAHALCRRIGRVLSPRQPERASDNHGESMAGLPQGNPRPFMQICGRRSPWSRHYEATMMDMSLLDVCHKRGPCPQAPARVGPSGPCCVGREAFDDPRRQTSGFYFSAPNAFVDRAGASRGAQNRGAWSAPC
jgi:hypothetical protein